MMEAIKELATEVRRKVIIYTHIFVLFNNPFLCNKNIISFTSQNMNTVDHVSVFDMFPINSQEEIYKFLDNKDGLFKARCNGFFEYLFSTRSENMTMKKFGESLMVHLFTEEYRLSHHWPNILM